MRILVMALYAVAAVFLVLATMLDYLLYGMELDYSITFTVVVIVVALGVIVHVFLDALSEKAGKGVRYLVRVVRRRASR